VKLFVTLAVFNHCPSGWLNDSALQKAALEDAIVAGAFSRFEVVVVPFSPQGVTCCAIVGESHLALHSWPEEGRLFVDIVSCSTLESTRRALTAIEKALPSGRLEVLREQLIDPKPGPKQISNTKQRI
jgi:S-adenosylmethionine decarboxylase